jgi:hypothetical protein
MDTVALVDDQIDEGQALLDRLADAGMAVRVAWWAKPFDEDRWSLYIATPVEDEKGPLEAYRQILPVLRSMGDIEITSSDVKAIGEKHRLTQAVLETLRRYPGRVGSRSRLAPLEGTPFEDVYLYSPGRRVTVPIHGMVFRGEPGGALHLSFEPHDPHSTLTVESVGERHEYPAETGIDWLVAAPEGAALERNEIGLPVLVWKPRGKRTESRANEVWSLANLGLHGFRFLRRPVERE